MVIAPVPALMKPATALLVPMVTLPLAHRSPAIVHEVFVEMSPWLCTLPATFIATPQATSLLL